MLIPLYLRVTTVKSPLFNSIRTFKRFGEYVKMMVMSQNNELQHLFRRLKLQGKYLEEKQPQRYSDLVTRIQYLMFKINFKHYKRPWLLRPTIGPKEPWPDYYDPSSS